MLKCSVKGIVYLLELPWDPVLGSDGGVATCGLGAASTGPGQVRPGLASPSALAMLAEQLDW